MQYEVGICLQMGWIVWLNGTFPCGSHTDIKKAWQWLIGELDDKTSEVVQADGGYIDGAQYFITPSG